MPAGSKPFDPLQMERYTASATTPGGHLMSPLPNGSVSKLRLRDPMVAAARRTLLEGGRLTQEDGGRLFDAPLLELGRLADAVARDRHGDRVYFTVNRQLNPTNVCVLSCRFCDYA